MTRDLIQQQMYTRARGGIFLTNDGYDTIAISEGLDKAFVKKYLHPICIYHSPKTLTERGEKDESLYPEALTLIQPETGDMILGQAVFVPADFTGQRSTYFMHNYIIPQSLKEEWIKNPAKLFQMNGFKTTYDMELGQTLPEQTELSSGETDLIAGKDELLVELGLTESIFKQLLFAVMSSISGKKKVYISLNVPLADYTRIARKLLELLYHYLPYAYRRKLGAMTFSSEPEGKKYIHVMFFEPGTFNFSDRSLEKQFIFDFSKRRISGVDLEGQHEYLNFAWECLSAANKLDDFFEFAERALSGFDDEKKLELSSYYQLTAIYQTFADRDPAFFEKNKIGFLNSLLNFLQVNNAEKADLERLFLGVLHGEKIATDTNTAIDYIHAVLRFNQMVPREEILSFILNTLEYHEDHPVFHELWKMIEADKISYQRLFEWITQHPKYERLLDLYLEERFTHVTRMKDFLNELNKFLSAAPFLLKNQRFQSRMIQKAANAVGDAADPFTAAKAVKEFTLNNQVAEFATFKAQLLVFSEIALLDEMDLNTLTLENIKTFGQLTTGKIKEKGQSEKRIIQKYMIMNTLYELFSTQKQTVALSLKPLPVSSRDELRDVLKNVLKSNQSTQYFPLLLAAFDDDDGSYHYSQLFTYLCKNMDDTIMLSFIQWSLMSDVRSDPYYFRSLKNYLKSHPQSILKNKTARKELQQFPSYSLKKILREIRNETASTLVKFFRRYGAHLSLGILILALGSGVFLGYNYLAEKKKEQAAATAEANKAATAAKENKKVEDVLVPSTQWTAEEPFKFNQNQLQISFGPENPDGGKSLVVTDSNNAESPVTLTAKWDKSPFDENGALKTDFALSAEEYDFDGDGTPELVIIAKNVVSESFFWIFSVHSNGKEGEERITEVFSEFGENGVKLEDKKLILTSGNGYIDVYSYVNQEFVKQ